MILTGSIYNMSGFYVKKPVVIRAEQIGERVTDNGIIRETQFVLSPQFMALICIRNHDPGARLPPKGFADMGSTGKPHLHTANGPVEVKPGDWIALSEDNDVWPIEDKFFKKNYVEAPAPIGIEILWDERKELKDGRDGQATPEQGRPAIQSGQQGKQGPSEPPAALRGEGEPARDDQVY